MMNGLRGPEAIHHSSFILLHSLREGGRNPGPAVQGSGFKVQGSRFGVGCSMLRCEVLGSEVFRQELPAAAVERVGPCHYGAQRQETGLQKAERMRRFG